MCRSSWAPRGPESQNKNNSDNECVNKDRRRQTLIPPPACEGRSPHRLLGGMRGGVPTDFWGACNEHPVITG